MLFTRNCSTFPINAQTYYDSPLEIEWIDKNLPADEFAEQLLNFKNSKILVCDRELDKYIGVLKIKSFLLKNYGNRI